jgi:hypothetical protein
MVQSNAQQINILYKDLDAKQPKKPIAIVIFNLEELLSIF